MGQFRKLFSQIANPPYCQVMSISTTDDFIRKGLWRSLPFQGNRLGPTQKCALKKNERMTLTHKYAQIVVSCELECLFFPFFLLLCTLEYYLVIISVFLRQAAGSNARVCVKADVSVRVARLGLTQKYAQISSCELECLFFPFFSLTVYS